MTIAMAEGFELGNSLATYNQLTPNQMSGTGTTGSNITISATTMGTGGQSLKINQTNAYTPIIILAGTATQASLNAANKIVIGWRAKLNSAYNAPQNYGRGGFGVGNDSNLYGPMVQRNAANSLQCTVTTGTNSSVVGTPFLFPDYNAHYLTFVLTRTAANTYIQQFYIDTTLMVTSNNVYNWQASAQFTIESPYSAGTGGLDRRVWSEVDDMYVAIDQDPLGDIVIGKLTPGADVQAQWTRYGTGVTTNYGAVDRRVIDDTTGVTGVVGNADLYSVTDTMPAGRRLAAVNVTAGGYGQTTDTVQANAKIGATTVNGPSTAMAAFGGYSSTGWDVTLAGMNVSNLQFGMTKTA